MTMNRQVCATLACIAAISFPGMGSAQQPAAPSYGYPGVTLEQAKKASEAAEAEAGKNNWHMAIVVVSNSGDLIHFARMDDTQFGSAAAFRRPTKVFQDAINGTPPATNIATLGAIAVEGGLPLIANGKVVGAIGCSGGTAAEDAQACRAGAATIK
jgi:uncharacterized protein GlcG (DUF336 family)